MTGLGLSEGTSFHRIWVMGLVAWATVLRATSAAETVSCWQRWQHILTSSRAYANPCADVTLCVFFEGPGGLCWEALGFWDGDNRYLVRCAFPTPGRWRWTTVCSDEANHGLHGQSGVVDVKQPVNSTNPLIRHGHLKVSADGRLLVHADGTPFLWIGDTCWAAPVHATVHEWKAYVASRVAKGYSVLQLSIAPDWALQHSRLGIPPFLSQLPDITKPNPRFFQELDRRLAEANDRGLVVMMVGLMETPYRYPPPEQVAIFSRYVAARYSSYAVIFSPSFDSDIREAVTLAAAQAIREACPRSLITMHMGTGVGPHFHSADWLSFDMYQSGHNGGDRARQSARATGMAAELEALRPRKPIINGEAIYEGGLGGSYDVRRTAWLSFLSGAVGYTAGIDQVYEWAPDVLNWLDVPSSDEIALLAKILRAIPWTRLEPASKRILNQPEDRARLMAAAFSFDKSIGLAYLPENDAIELDLSGTAPKYETLWVNPCTGEWLDGPTTNASRRARFAAPDARDWLMVLARPRSGVLESLRKIGRRLVLAKRGRTVVVSFAPDKPVGGLILKLAGDGKWVPSEYQSKSCLVNENPQRNSYLYFDLDDRVAFRGGSRRLRVEVLLHSDDPLENLQLHYDAQGPPQTSTFYKPVAPAERKQEGAWTRVSFVAESPYLGGRQNSGADLRIFFDGRQCRVASVKVAVATGSPR